MAASFGIHVGTSSTCIAVNKDGKTAVLANDAGDRVTPAVVSFNNGELSVGLTSRNACNNLYNCVRLIGRPDLENEEIADVLARSACKIIKGLKGELFYELINDDGKPTKYSAKHILGLIFKQLLETATSHSGIQGDRTAVLAVSLKYTDEQVAYIREAATSAGFKVIQVIKEPAAALLSAEIVSKADCSSQFCLVYRVGGNSLDATVVCVRDELYRIVASVHKSDLGGDEVTKLLVNLLAEEFKRRYKVDVSNNPRALLKLRQVAEESKRILSSLVTTTCSVESLCDGIDFTCPLSRSMLEILFNNALPQFLRPLEEVLEKANMKMKNIDVVLLCGGTCKIPQLQKAVAQFFTSPRVTVLDSSSPPDETLAIGAANQAMHLCHQEPKYEDLKDTTFPVVARNVYYRILDANKSERKQVFNAGTIVPARKEITVRLGANANKPITIDVFEEDENGDEIFELLLLRETLSGLPENVASVRLLFEATSDNNIKVCLAEALPERSNSAVVRDRSRK